MNIVERINWDFAYHAPPDETRKNEHEAIRDILKQAALHIERIVPPSREQSLAITKLEEAMMWANAGLARQQTSFID